MSIKKIIRIIMTMKGMTNQTLAKKCGYATASGISNILSRGSGMRIDSLLKIVDALDCEVVIKSKNSSEEWKIEIE